MANSFQDITQVLTPLKDTVPPQSVTVTGNGNAIDVADVGTNRINAYLHCGDATALTSLAVKMQASPNGSTGWVDIEGATFTTVTSVASGGNTPEGIQFQLPESASASADPYRYVRAAYTLVGTSVRMAVTLLACRKWDGAAGYVSAPMPVN